MKLYVIPGSPNCRKVTAVVAYLGLEVTQKTIELPSGELNSPAIRSLNPNGLTPILEDDDFVLWESNAITQYLAAGTDLFPDDRQVRADIARWQFWESAHYGKAAGDLVWENFAKPHFGVGEPDEHVVADAQARYRKFASVLDYQLADRTFVTGEGVSIADFCLASHAAYLKPARIPYDEFSHLTRWYEQLSKIEAWRVTAPF